MNCTETFPLDADGPIHFWDKTLRFRLVFGALAELASEPSATSRRGDAMRHKGERCAVVNLTRLHFDGVRQVHGTLHQLSNRHVLSVLHVPREDTGLQPF